MVAGSEESLEEEITRIKPTLSPWSIFFGLNTFRTKERTCYISKIDRQTKNKCRQR